MILIELSRSVEIEGFVSEGSPFVLKLQPGSFELATYWTAWTGETSENGRIYINQVLVNFEKNYSILNSLAGCVAQEGSFFWDNGNQVLYVHHTHLENLSLDSFSVGKAQGLSNGDTVYVDDIYYAPLLRGIPKVSQSVDITEYDSFNFESGAIELDNTSGLFDDIITDPIYGNQISMYYCANGKSNVTRAALIQIASYYVEDYQFSLSRLTITAMDKRKSQNAKVIKEYLADGTAVPIMFGQVAVAKAIPVNPDATGDITFRVAQSLITLGTVQVDIDGVWTPRSTSSTDLATGQFTLSALDGRVGGSSTAGPLECRVLLPSGSTVTSSADIIKQLNYSAFGTVYNPSNYDTTEYENESLGLSGGGILFDEEITLFDAIKAVQNGGSKGFRYEILPSGKITIRVDDNSRIKTFFIGSESVQNINEIPVSSDASVLAASVIIKHSKDYNSGRFHTLTDISQEQIVLAKYRQKPVLISETHLTNQTDAQIKATWLLDRLSTVPRTVTVTAMGAEFLDLRILDTGVLQTSLENGRTYFGTLNVKVIGINPDYETMTNELQLQII